MKLEISDWVEKGLPFMVYCVLDVEGMVRAVCTYREDADRLASLPNPFGKWIVKEGRLTGPS